MARVKLGFRKSLRDQRESVDKAMRHMAILAGREVPAGMLNNVPPKRERAAPRKLEAPVVAAISELLAVHPRVIWAGRFNSGAAGEHGHIWFHKFVRMPEKMRMPDFFGLIECKLPEHDNFTNLNLEPLPIAIEAKAPGWTKPRDDREREQAAFLAMIRNAGGIGIFATSVDDVVKALA